MGHVVGRTKLPATKSDKRNSVRKEDYPTRLVTYTVELARTVSSLAILARETLFRPFFLYSELGIFLIISDQKQTEISDWGEVSKNYFNQKLSSNRQPLPHREYVASALLVDSYLHGKCSD